MANAGDPDGSIASVKFYAKPNTFGGVAVLLGSDTTAPYSYKWAGAAPGGYSLTAVAVDNQGCSATSGSVAISVSGANSAPSVTLTAPNNGATISAPATIAMSATAVDLDGTIAKVQFFNGATLLGTDTTSPYSFSWTNVPAGSYTLTAKATDNGGAVATSAAATVTVVAPLPVVSLTSPAAGSSFNAPASITLSANASIASGTITKVEFLDGTAVVGTDTTAPYSMVWTGATVGSHSLKARATSSFATVATSPAVTISVTNPPPSVSLTSPANGASFVAPASISLCATASDSNGSVAKVEFFNGATLIGTDTTSPYCFTWSNVAAGSYTLTAKATDNLGAMTTSPGVMVSVGAPNVGPTVSLTAPAYGAIFTTPFSTTLNASASDANGVSKVEFFDGATLLGTDTTAPYSVPWSSTVLGSHSLTARATDALGAVSTSAPVVVTVARVTLSATNKTVTSSVPSGSTASAAFRLASAGKLRFQTSVGGAWDEQSPFAEWLEPESGVTAAQFEVLATSASGVLPSSGAMNQWLNLGSATPRDWVLTRSVAGTSQAVVTIQIRRVGTTTILASANVTLNATVANTPPSVNLTAPSNGASFVEPATILLAADAIDAEGSITQVAFYHGVTLLATDTVAPYSFKWAAVPAGTYTITAKALDDTFLSSTSAAVTVTVSTCPPMTVALTAPSDGAVFDAPATITLGAVPSTCAGSISKVEFYQGTTLLVTDTAGPFYAATWSPVGAGTYSLTAKAYNTLGDSVVSAVSTITVNAENAAPVVSLTNPVENASFSQGASIALQATATDSDGTISAVEFFDGTSSIGFGTANGTTYTRDWTTATIGTHSITAKATDNSNAVTTSAARTITVNSSPLTVMLTAPTAGATFNAPAEITLSADASDANGTITAVEFFKDDGTTWLGQAAETTSPYTFVWSDVPAGDYTLSARVTNDLGATAVTAALSVSVSVPEAPMCFVLPLRPGSAQ